MKNEMKKHTIFSNLHFYTPPPPEVLSIQLKFIRGCRHSFKRGGSKSNQGDGVFVFTLRGAKNIFNSFYKKDLLLLFFFLI